MKLAKLLRSLKVTGSLIGSYQLPVITDFRYHLAKPIGLGFLVGVFCLFFFHWKKKFQALFIYPDFRKLTVHGGKYRCHPENNKYSGCALHSERSSALRQLYFCLVKKKILKKSMQYLRNDLAFHTNEYSSELSPFDQNFSVWWTPLFKISGAYLIKISNKAYKEHVFILIHVISS